MARGIHTNIKIIVTQIHVVTYMVNEHMHMHTHAHTHTHTHTHARTHAHTQVYTLHMYTHVPSKPYSVTKEHNLNIRTCKYEIQIS